MYYNNPTLTMVQVFLTKMTPKTHHASLEWFFKCFFTNGIQWWETLLIMDISSTWAFGEPSGSESHWNYVLRLLVSSCSYPKMIQKGNCCGTCVTCVPRGPTRFAHQIGTTLRAFLIWGYIWPQLRESYIIKCIYII